jgi:integrase
VLQRIPKLREHSYETGFESRSVWSDGSIKWDGEMVFREGKTKGLGVKQARQLLASIDVATPGGLRDRAVIATLIYTAARRGAVAKLKRQDFHTDGRQHYFQLDEKGTPASPTRSSWPGSTPRTRPGLTSMP